MKRFALLLAVLMLLALAPMTLAKAEGIPPCCEKQNTVLYPGNYYYYDSYSYNPYYSGYYNYVYTPYYVVPTFQNPTYVLPSYTWTVDEDCNWVYQPSTVEVAFYSVDNTPFAVYSSDSGNYISFGYQNAYWYDGEGNYYGNPNYNYYNPYNNPYYGYTYPYYYGYNYYWPQNPGCAK